MEHLNEKCVMVINAELPLGLIANTAGILGVTLGKNGAADCWRGCDGSNRQSPSGVVGIPVPILSVSKEKLKTIREQLYQPEFSELTVVDFSDIAQSCKNYPEYIEKIANVTEEEITYFGIGIYGPKKRVNKLTGDLPCASLIDRAFLTTFGAGDRVLSALAKRSDPADLKCELKVEGITVRSAR